MARASSARSIAFRIKKRTFGMGENTFAELVLDQNLQEKKKRKKRKKKKKLDKKKKRKKGKLKKKKDAEKECGEKEQVEKDKLMDSEGKTEEN